MRSFFTIIKSDYLQRTRSYAFLITLCASLAIAYTFVPEPNANYSTIRIDDYVGYYNSAWFGYVTAIMTSIFLSLIGFYLINSGIKKDIETKVGYIVASTPISNFKYLFAKVLSNFMLLATIVFVVFIMSIILFILYNDGFSFEAFQFLKPYLFITIPSLFFISCLAVVFEVFLGKYSVIQNIGFFFLFTALLVFTPKAEMEYSLDIFGSKIVLNQFEETVRAITKSDEKSGLTNIGYVFGNLNQTKKFEFNGMDFPMSFIMSRFLWMLLGIGIIGIISRFFHRFNLRERTPQRSFKKAKEKHLQLEDIVLSNLSITKINYGILPLLKTELLLLFRKGKKWLWIVNVIAMSLLVVLPLKISHQIVLPILWFLQVGRISDLSTKEEQNNVHNFILSAYKPLNRIMTSQLLSGVILMLFLALPLMLRYFFLGDFSAAIIVVLGGVFIVMLASFLGLLSQGKKLFEILFFMITYANINKIAVVDYFGAFEHSRFYALNLAILVTALIIASYIIKSHKLKA